MHACIVFGVALLCFFVDIVIKWRSWDQWRLVSFGSFVGAVRLYRHVMVTIINKMLRKYYAQGERNRTCLCRATFIPLRARQAQSHHA